MNRVMQLGANTKGRDFVIGDIHGKYDLLCIGLEKVGFDYGKDRLIAVGDLIDRGDKNMQCLKLIWENWFYTTVGNHELMMANALTMDTKLFAVGQNPLHFWTMNGGDWYYNLEEAEITVLTDIYAPHIYEVMPLAIEFIAENGQRVGVTHGGLPRNWTWTETVKHLEHIKDIYDVAAQNVLWTRTRIQQTCDVPDILDIDLLINGHTPSKKEVWRGNNVFIDLGAHNPYQLIPINIMDLFGRMGTNEERCIPA